MGAGFTGAVEGMASMYRIWTRSFSVAQGGVYFTHYVLEAVGDAYHGES